MEDEMAATIYSITGDEITSGLQGCSVCDEAVQAAYRIAEDRAEAVILEDDDGTWRITPDGDSERLDEPGTGREKEIDGYVTEWDGVDQVGVFLDHCGGPDGTDPVETFVCIGKDPDADPAERWAVLDTDEEGEGRGAVSRHASREEAWAEAEEYLRLAR